MAIAGLDVFDTSIQKTNIWLNEIMEELDWQEKRKAYMALKVVLHTLRNCLPPGEAIHLGSQLPLLIAGVYYEGWKISRERLRRAHKEGFVQKIADAFERDIEVDPAQVAAAVLKVLKRKISDGQVQNIQGTLPKELGEFWANAA